MAIAELGSGDEAVELFHMINPINHARHAADDRALPVEPYVLAGDVYGSRRTSAAAVGPGTRARRAGCIASASRTSSVCAGAATPSSVDPCVPSSWTDYTIDWRHGSSRYEITVTNPQRVWTGVVRADLDGAVVNHLAIPLTDDGATHVVRITMGRRD